MNPHVKRIEVVADKLRGTSGGRAMTSVVR